MLEERNSPFKAIVAFTDKVINGKVVTEAELNGFPSAEIEQRIEPYRFLIVADKFRKGGAYRGSPVENLKDYGDIRTQPAN